MYIIQLQKQWRFTNSRCILHEIYHIKFEINFERKVLDKSQEEIETHINLHAEELIKQRDIIIKALVSKDLEETVASLNSVQFGEEISKAAALYNEQKKSPDF